MRERGVQCGGRFDQMLDDLALVTGDEIRGALAEANAVLIGYREIRDVMRAG